MEPLSTLSSEDLGCRRTDGLLQALISIFPSTLRSENSQIPGRTTMSQKLEKNVCCSEKEKMGKSWFFFFFSFSFPENKEYNDNSEQT